jgi:hypothetical protein
MIEHKEKAGKKSKQFDLNGPKETIAPEKIAYQFKGMNVTVNPDLSRFSGDEFLPEKHKQDEIRLKNSVIPDSSSFLK